MKKIVLFAAVVFVFGLTGCGAVQQAQLNSASNQAQDEIAATCSPLLTMSSQEASVWTNGKGHLTKCFNGITEPWPRNEQTKEAMQCATTYLDQQIRPVAYSQKNFDQYMKDRANEQQAYMDSKIDWETFNHKGQARLAKYLENANMGSYFNFANCQNSVIQRTVMPSYAPQLRPLLLKYMADISAFSRNADKNKMSLADYQVGSQNLWSDFAMKEQQAISTANAQKAQAWQNYSARMQQFSGQLIQAEKAQAQQCDSISIAPIASPGCKNVCINGNWAEVC